MSNLDYSPDEPDVCPVCGLAITQGCSPACSCISKEHYASSKIELAFERATEFRDILNKCLENQAK